MANFLEQLKQVIAGLPQDGGDGAPQPQAPQPALPEQDNILQQLLSAQPMSDPMQAPQFGGPPPVNVMQQLSGASPDAPAPSQVSPEPVVQPRQRHSLIDTIGRISDVLAKVGGADAQYQPTLDAREDRSLAKEDRLRGIDLDGLRKKLLEQQVGSGETAAGNAGEDRQRAMLGQAVRGLSAIAATNGPAGIVKAWPQMAQMMGLSPEKTAEIGQQLAADPEGTLAGLAAATDPTKATGSQAKELQVYGLLKKTNPELAETYLAKIAEGKGNDMTPYQAAQINLAKGRLGLATERYLHPIKAPDAKAAAAEDQVKAAEAAVPIIDGLKDAVERLKNAGSMNAPGQSAEGRVGSWAMQNVPGLERITNPEAYSARQDFDRLTTQGIGSLLPLLGGIKLGGKNIDAAKELETWKKAITSASDYNSAMRALKGFEDRINELTNPQTQSTPAAKPSQRILPRRAPAASAGGWGKATVVK